MTTDEELEQLRQENSALRDHVAILSERISTLEAQLAKDSHNSHLPPSSDHGNMSSVGSSATSVLWIQPLFVDKEGETHVLQFINSSKVIINPSASIFSPWF